MKNINRFRALLGALLITVVVISLSSCFLFVEPTIPIAGTWELVTPGEWGGTETWEITDNTISYDGTFASYTADVVGIGINIFNAGDITITNTASTPVDDYGFAVIRYTAVSDSGTGTVGKYNIFRWQENATDDDKLDFTQGYKSVGGDPVSYDNEVFDTAAAAQTGATIANGYFEFASSGASKVTD